MITYDITTLEISKAVLHSLRAKKWTVTHCCNAYNKNRKTNLLQKDFVHRIRKNQFSVISPRVVDLCNFLKIDTKRKFFSHKLRKQIEAVELLAHEDPAIEKKLKILLKSIVDIAEA